MVLALREEVCVVAFLMTTMLFSHFPYFYTLVAINRDISDIVNHVLDH